VESAPLHAPARVAWAKEWLPALGDILLERQPTLRAGDRPGGGRDHGPSTEPSDLKGMKLQVW